MVENYTNGCADDCEIPKSGKIFKLIIKSIESLVDMFRRTGTGGAGRNPIFINYRDRVVETGLRMLDYVQDYQSLPHLLSLLTESPPNFPSKLYYNSKVQYSQGLVKKSVRLLRQSLQLKESQRALQTILFIHLQHNVLKESEF